jgi:hypothetical protein
METPYSDILVLDLETLYSADDCRWCGLEQAKHQRGAEGLTCPTREWTTYQAITWNEPAMMSISIGGYYSSVWNRIFWFDAGTVEATMTRLCAMDPPPLIVSFNGQGFDAPLMLRCAFPTSQDAQTAEAQHVVAQWKTLWDASYDLLAEIVKVDPGSQRKGVNNLDALREANGLARTPIGGKEIPRLWREGRYGEVLNHCADDIMATYTLFCVTQSKVPLQRLRYDPVTLPAVLTVEQQGAFFRLNPYRNPYRKD